MPPAGRRADQALLDEVADLLDRTPSLGHVVLDEAQDLSPMQLRAVGRRASTGSLTVLGDIAQGTTPWATESWSDAMGHLGRPGHELVVLDRGFRVPGLVIDFAARLLPHMAPGLGAPQSVRDNPGRLTVVPTDVAGRAGAVAQAVRDAVTAPGSVGVIAPDAGIAALSAALTAAGVPHGRLDAEHGDDEDRQVELVPASIAKGLEFDRVVVVEPAEIADAEPDERTGLRRLYVVLTRAVSELTVVHAEPLPSALADGLTGGSSAGLLQGPAPGPARQASDQDVDEVRAPRRSRPGPCRHRCCRARSTARPSSARGARTPAALGDPRGRRRPPHHGSGAGTPRP